MENEFTPTRKLKEALFTLFLENCFSETGVGPVEQFESKLGFTGHFSGLDRTMAKEDFIEALCDIEERYNRLKMR